MALFNGVDRELPLLTQVMQLDVSNLKEIDQFWMNRFKQTHGLDTAALKHLADAIKLTQDLTNDLFDTGEMDEPLVLTLIDHEEVARKRRQMSYRIDRRRKSRDQDASTRVSPHDVKSSTEELPADLFLMDEITISTFEELIRYAGKRLHKCEECNNIYVAIRSSRNWCSKRCAQRIGERRRYKAERIAS